MKSLQRKVADFAESNSFAALDFCGAYWKILLEPELYCAYGTISTQAVYICTRVFHGLKLSPSIPKRISRNDLVPCKT